MGAISSFYFMGYSQVVTFHLRVIVMDRRLSKFFAGFVDFRRVNFICCGAIGGACIFRPFRRTGISFDLFWGLLNFFYQFFTFERIYGMFFMTVCYVLGTMWVVVDLDRV